MDRPLVVTGPCALAVEWGNPSCCVPGLCALIDVCSFRSTTHYIQQEVIKKDDKKKAYIGIDIGKKKCDTCVIDERGRMLERGQYCNTAVGAASYAKGIAAKYDVNSAACETTGNMWTRTFGAFEDAGINIKLANTYKMAIIARTGKKDKITISVDHGLTEWLDSQIKQKRFCGRSHAFEYVFLRMRNESQKPAKK